MSGSKAKKHSKGDQIPKPINIKKEKIEEDRTLHPISHYIDDRLELVKQIFGTLKPKTIMNLAPEFLKKTPMDEIEELCLEELLCLSTKRLKSIIEDTKCPTDTESSEDSDVEHKEEHISLEEISSDSDIGGQESRRNKKKLKAKKANNENENKESGGQMSVLELLELQARARAIRSQLAMEPITKIEVKSDDDEEIPDEKVKHREKEKRSNKNKESGKRKTQESKAVGEGSSISQADADSSCKEQQTPRKKIKIKRNYRQSSKSPEKENPAPASVPPPLSESSVPNKETRKLSRSASPDVITIQTEPETLLISDSTDDESTKQKSNEIINPTPLEPPAPLVESEPEEGEVRDESEEPANSEGSGYSVKPEETVISKEQGDQHNEECSEKLEKSADDEHLPEEVPLAKQNPPSDAKEPVTSQPAILDDEDQNDDVISIGGDLEMIEEMTKEDELPSVSIKNEKKEKMSDPDEMDNDVISLDTSEDERDKIQRSDSEQSWRTRYMKSSKVSQVLAESRLAKRVRDKLKKSKRSKVSASNEQEKSEKPIVFTSKHEDGSIEQYQELLQHRQRKTSNSSKGDK
ncbi:enolase-phosphatase E1 [Drosophila eugracilis]|uniref:enolase-phosphatase E1 n=1 Tax=Drosophila eugracilis TaxID=29029 RepID=UPI0007E72C16|nr:enolase-phosphatase E1 [Drosophila eugracilis]